MTVDLLKRRWIKRNTLDGLLHRGHFAFVRLCGVRGDLQFDGFDFTDEAVCVVF